MIQDKLVEMGMSNAIDVTKWEVLDSVVDSGATVPVMNPGVGKAYEVTESEASRAGTCYEVANSETIPNIGEKHMAVVTREGSIRGYASQCADLGDGKALQSVRSLCKTGHSVLFGVGPSGEDHIIVNRLTGETNAIYDNGVNFVQKLIIVPPSQVDALMMLAQCGFGDAIREMTQGFTGRGR